MAQMDTALLRNHPLFSFGTLQDADVFHVVTGGLSLKRIPHHEAWLADYRVVNAIDGPHPVLQPAAGDWAPGLLIHDLPESALDRIAWFEWPEFQPGRRLVVTGGATRPCACFLPEQTFPASEAPWSLEGWAREEKTELMAYAELMMEFYRVCTAEELDLYWEDLLARVKGRQGQLPSHMEARCLQLGKNPGRFLEAYLRLVAFEEKDDHSAAS
ncbi:gamma-glutamylcyclotransferase family protein [Fodinicurvata sediminis]|uniref:gamma-glutamylcyclotransferase family protein n=1 Tax=Fodinicurvata sediminis TaxID=1121832 RepID=UPI0003B5EFF7|nr:gamma-glutamylcyclotransferase family protein [Fodinicurvata sediminis]